MIGVVDYRAGNSPSVVYALERLGVSCRLVATPEEVGAVERLVLPGVGAARATLESLDESGLVEPLGARVRDGVPFLGICIGLQVLFDHSEEGDMPGLGWIPGQVLRLPTAVRIPQIGWNAVTWRRPHALVDGLPDGGHFYFVNSYYAAPDDSDVTVGVASYGVEMCALAVHDNVVATQFHAEKSGELGLRLLENFAGWDGR